jgi:rare lipoprotein A
MWRRFGAPSVMALAATTLVSAAPAPVERNETAPQQILAPLVESVSSASDEITSKFPPGAVIQSLPAHDKVEAEEDVVARKMIGSGEASYYGPGFAGRRTASGEIFNPSQLTAAHRTLPMGSKVRVINKRNGKSVVVRINDRGPFTKGRVIDLSVAAARQINMIQSGKAPVSLELLS